jgi:DNA repair exonuclease SbcCD nuclease subunit
MTENLFKHAACFTDIHFGIRNNSRQHNQDCEDFIHWFIDEALARGCETCIFLGDFHHHRASVNVSTLNYSVSNLKKLSEAFDDVYVLVGNHDLFYREKREINSFPYADLFGNIHIINDNIVEKGNVSLVPWLVGDEWKQMSKLKSKYVFGHFELPHFMMNAIVQMPDHGELKSEHFTKPDLVFSGHFHKRQIQDKVHYLGSPFAHNYADVWDDDRGAMFLEWGDAPIYVNYDGPRYVRLNLSDLIDKPEDYLNEKTYCRAMLDVPISYEEANFIKETFMTQFNPRELSLIPVKKEDMSVDPSVEGDYIVESVDQIVYSQLQSVESEMINTKLLTDIYKDL